jgi:hypothetical protein
MALIRADRVKESSTSTGTGTFTLAGADSTYRTFASVCAVGDTVYYAIAHRTANEWEVGLGTYSATNTLTRTTVHSSSNANAAVTFSAGTKDVLLALTKTQLETYATLAGTETLTNKTISGANNTITNVSLTSGVTGTLPLANGGTGATTQTTAATSLIGNPPNDGLQYTLASKKTSGTPSFYWVDSTGYAPTLDLLFAADKSLTAYTGPTPSYSRASTGAYFNASGVLTTAAVNAPRFNHVYNGSSWVSKGLLVEEQRTNVCTYSEDFTNGVWTKTRSSISSNATTAPNGTSTADKLIEGASSTTHVVTFTTVTGGVFSVFAKASERSWIALQQNSPGNYCYFNLSSGTVGSASGSTGSITSVGNGWYRCSIAVTSASSMWDIFVATGDNGASYTGDGTSGVFLWGAQVETGSFSTSYISTTTAAVTRSADVCQITGTDFSGFWNQTEGTISVEYDTYVPNTNTTYNTRVVAVSDVGSDLNRIFVSPNASAGPPNGQYFEIRHNSSGQTATLSNTPFIGGGATVKISCVYKVDDIAASFNGGAILSDNSQAVPTGCDIMRLGSSPVSSNYLSGHISRLRYYPVRIPNATLQVLST